MPGAWIHPRQFASGRSRKTEEDTLCTGDGWRIGREEAEQRRENKRLRGTTEAAAQSDGGWARLDRKRIDTRKSGESREVAERRVGEQGCFTIARLSLIHGQSLQYVYTIDQLSMRFSLLASFDSHLYTNINDNNNNNADILT